MRSLTVSSSTLWAAIILLPVALPGCGGSGQSGSATTPQNAESVQSTAAKIGQMPSDEECREWAARIERAAIEGDTVAFNAEIDYDAMLESATGGIPGMEDIRKQFNSGVKQSIKGSNGFASTLCNQVAMGGSYVFLCTNEVDNQKRVLFRLLPSTGGINYNEWILVRDLSGKVKAVDVYVFLTAELMSKTLRRGYLPLIADKSRSILSKLTSGESEFIKKYSMIGDMSDAIRNGNFSRVLSIYDALPPLLKKEKTCLLLRIQAASSVGNDTTYLEAIEDFRKFYPKDPCVALISIDRHIMKNNYDEAINSIEQLQQSVGADPYLLFLKGNVHYLKGDQQSARSLMGEAIQAEPTLQDPYWGLVTVSLSEKDFDETNRLLDQLEEKFQIEFDDLTQIPEYSEYVQSPQYQQWSSRRNSNRR